MKKGEIVEGIVKDVQFPNKGIVVVQDEADIPVHVKNVIEGQKVLIRIIKKNATKAEGQLLEVIEKSPIEIKAQCPHFEICGGCTYQNILYDNQCEMKEKQMINIFKTSITNELRKNASHFGFEIRQIDDYFDKIFEGLKPSPVSTQYRNKMEFSFGDSEKGGILELGLHKKGSFYDIVSVKQCQIVDSDYRIILDKTLNYFRGIGCSFFHKISHEGFLRHLLIRKAVKTGEILVCLVTSSQIPENTPCSEKGIVEDWKEELLNMKYKGKLAGILHVINDSLSDTIQSDETRILYGQDYFYEELLGLKFKVTPFSFFQTNSLSAEVIYKVAREYIESISENTSSGETVLYDLYSGTGTISQLMASSVKKVIGVEIVEEAVVAARENARLNGISNCNFIADDVLKALDNISEKPDFIILDPPRDGVNPKALRKIIDYGVNNILYISCKPTSLSRDFEMLIGCGYLPVRMCCVDQFPNTVHVETVVLMSKVNIVKD